jgi:hypothetical protein
MFEDDCPRQSLQTSGPLLLHSKRPNPFLDFAHARMFKFLSIGETLVERIEDSSNLPSSRLPQHDLGEQNCKRVSGPPPGVVELRILVPLQQSPGKRPLPANGRRQSTFLQFSSDCQDMVPSPARVDSRKVSASIGEDGSFSVQAVEELE